MVLNASAASVLKTETSIDCDEFDEFLFSDGIWHLDLVGDEFDRDEGTENFARPYLEDAQKGPQERVDKSIAFTNFEKKYDDVGEKTYELVLRMKEIN